MVFVKKKRKLNKREHKHTIIYTVSSGGIIEKFGAKTKHNREIIPIGLWGFFLFQLAFAKFRGIFLGSMLNGIIVICSQTVESD